MEESPLTRHLLQGASTTPGRVQCTFPFISLSPREWNCHRPRLVLQKLEKINWQASCCLLEAGQSEKDQIGQALVLFVPGFLGSVLRALNLFRSFRKTFEGRCISYLSEVAQRDGGSGHYMFDWFIPWKEHGPHLIFSPPIVPRSHQVEEVRHHLSFLFLTNVPTAVTGRWTGCYFNASATLFCWLMCSAFGTEIIFNCT